MVNPLLAIELVPQKREVGVAQLPENNCNPEEVISAPTALKEIVGLVVWAIKLYHTSDTTVPVQDGKTGVAETVAL